MMSFSAVGSSSSSSSTSFPSAEQVKDWFMQSVDASDNAGQYHASLQLQHSICLSYTSEAARAALARVCFELFTTSSSNHQVQFAALSTLTRLSLTVDERTTVRNYLLRQWCSYHNNPEALVSCPVYLRNKAALLLTQYWRLDAVASAAATSSSSVSSSSSWERDMLELAETNPWLFLKTWDTLLEDFLLVGTTTITIENNAAAAAAGIGETGGINHKEAMRCIKDKLKGYDTATTTGQQQQQQQQQQQPTPLQQLFAKTVDLLGASLANNKNNNNNHCPHHDTFTVLALETVQRMFQWTDLDCLGTPASISLVLEYMLLGIQSNHPLAVQLASLSAWTEWNSSCSSSTTSTTVTSEEEEDHQHHHKWRIQSTVLERLHEYQILPVSGEESTADIHVVIQVAQLISSFGTELLSTSSSLSISNHSNLLADLWSKILDFLFRAFRYDDIDVSGAVIPLAMAWAHHAPSNTIPPLEPHLPQFLNILYQQLKYPSDFSYDFEESDENAEEEQYRVELCKLYVQYVRVAPSTCLQFLCEAAAATAAATTTTTTADQEATLRLIYTHAEGVRPTPGVVTVLKHATFCDLLVVVHTNLSPTTTLNQQHAQSEQWMQVVSWYYEVAVRHCAFYKQPGRAATFLGPLLQTMTGPLGLQHPHSQRIRSRCAYLWLRLVQAVVGLFTPMDMETAVQGISALLSSGTIRPDDTLYLFEAMGLLLGGGGSKTSHNAKLSTHQQRDYLTRIMTPHVQSIQAIILQQQQDQAMTATTSGAHKQQNNDDDDDDDDEGNNDPGESLSYSIAAMAYLTKGFSNTKQALPEEIQQVLLEATGITEQVLIHAAATSPAVRNKVMVFLQRMIQSLDRAKLVPIMPRFAMPLIQYCTVDDILFVAQLINQLCIKFKQDAVPAVDTCLLPFLQKCHALAMHILQDATTTIDHLTNNNNVSSPHATVPSHVYTEQLSIQKLAYTVLHHIVMHKVMGVLTSPTNASHLPSIFATVQVGALHINDDPVIQRTCLKFFKQLLEQLTAPEASMEDDDGNNASTMSFSTATILFCRTSLVPNVWQAMLTNPSFDERNAQQFRNVSELASIVDALRLLQQPQLEAIPGLTFLADAPPPPNTNAVEQGLLQALRQYKSSSRETTTTTTTTR